MRPEGQVSSGRGGGGGLRLSETELRSKFKIGRAHFERVIMSQLGRSGDMFPPGKFFKFEPSEMAGNAT